MRDKPMRSGLVIGGTTILPAVYLHYHNRLMYPDVLSQIPPDVQNQNFLVIYGRDKDKDGNFSQVFKFPKMTYDRYFTTPVENFLDWMYNNNPKAWWKTAMQMTSDISPVSFMQQGQVAPLRAIAEAAPPIVGAAAELLAGKDFYTGYPIEPKSSAGGSPWERWGTTPSTLELEKTTAGKALIQISRFLRVGSPLQYRHLLRRLGAGGGRLLLDPSEEDTATSHTLSLLGVEAMKKMFIGAPSGAEEIKTEQAMAPYEQQTVDEDIERRRNRVRVLEDAQKKPEDQRGDVVLDALDSGAIDEQSACEALLSLASNAAGLTKQQAALYWKPAHAKALYLMAMQSQLPEKQYQAMEDHFAELGYLNASVYGEMAKIQAQRETQRKPLAPAIDPAADAMRRAMQAGR